MQGKFLLISVILSLLIIQCLALKCHEDSIKPGEDGKYSLQECDEGTSFCAVLSNSKTSEVFHACATEKMCQKVGKFEFQQHEELRIRCCDTEGCNNAFVSTVSFLALSLIFVNFVRN